MTINGIGARTSPADLLRAGMEALAYQQEASARGAALLALEAMGLLPDVAQAPAHLRPDVKPDAEKFAVYRKGAARQQQLYQALLEARPAAFPH